MKNRLRIKVIVVLCILFAFHLFTCDDNGGGNTVADGSAEFVRLISNLDNQALDGQVSNEEFIEQYNNILDQINNSPNGPALFQEYLETEILGYEFIQSSINKISSISDGNSTLDIILKYIESIILCNPVVPAGELICAANPDIALVILSADVKRQIFDNFCTKASDLLKCNELMALHAKNPAEAKKQLHIALGEEIPDNFKTVPQGCFRRCDDVWLFTNINPSGGGTVTGPRSGPYPIDTPITLIATPADGYYFMGWGGDECSGRGPCEFTMDDTKTIIAHFSNELLWSFSVSWATSRSSGSCNYEVILPLNGGSSESVSCGDANITFSTTRSSVSISGLGNTSGNISIMSYNCIGSGGASGGIQETLDGFSGGGAISGSSNCVITNTSTGEVTTESLTVTGLLTAYAPKESP